MQHGHPRAQPRVPRSRTRCPGYPASLAPPSIAPTNLQILGFLLEYLKISYEIVPYYPPESVDWGKPRGPGNWSGILGQILDGSIDTSSSTWFLTKTRVRDFLFTYPTKAQRYGYIARKEAGSMSNSLFLGTSVLVQSTFTFTVSARIPSGAIQEDVEATKDSREGTLRVAKAEYTKAGIDFSPSLLLLPYDPVFLLFGVT